MSLQRHSTVTTSLEEEATVIALFRDGQAVETLNAGEEGVVVLDHTPFYAESGGQVGDSGWLRADGVEFVVNDTRKQGEGVFTHIGAVQQGSAAARRDGAGASGRRATSGHGVASLRDPPHARRACARFSEPM